MRHLQRDPANPLLHPSPEREWESLAAFNPSVAQVAGHYHMVYRAQAPQQWVEGQALSLSTIGHAHSRDGRRFEDRRQLIVPEHAWERYGCEDPRITWFEGRYFVFYTCLSLLPFRAAGIRVGLAITEDFRQLAKHPITPFNAKAMALFPQRVQGRIAAVLTVHTDEPPARIALATFDAIEELWSEDYWQRWYAELDRHVIPLLRSPVDQVEVGAGPLQTPAGWLLAHAYIRDYRGPQPQFRVEAALLDRDDPRQLRSRTSVPLLEVEAEYERRGLVPDVLFPSGALIEGGRLRLYYGAADTRCCLAEGALEPLLHALQPPGQESFQRSPLTVHGFRRFSGNPILKPRPEHAWEARAVFNPAALRLDGRVHLLYRAMALDGSSCFGYAASADGVHFDVRSPTPVYVPRETFESRLRPGNSGCEDPRLTVLDDRVYLFYTAFDGYTPRVAFSSLAIEDFLAKRWTWAPAQVITPPGIDDKDACLLPARVAGRYVIFHRAGSSIRVNSFERLAFGPGNWVDQRSAVIRPRKDYWDNLKFGIAAPPLWTTRGWLLLFHRVTRPGGIYKIEAMLLDPEDPTHVLTETAATLLEPETPEERYGQTPNVVFPCGAVLIDAQVYLYYGGADSVVCVARMALSDVFLRMGLE